MGRPKGSKNKTTNANSTPAKPSPAQLKEKAIAKNEEFDKLNIKVLTATPSPQNKKASPGRPRKSAGKSPSKAAAARHPSPEKVVLQNGASGEKENMEVMDEIGNEHTGVDESALKIIPLGTEEAKKYAILPTNQEDEGEESDGMDDYADREDHEISYVGDEFDDDEEEEPRQYGDDGMELASDETSTIRHAKKYPSKQKYPCPKCPKVWNWAWELRRHLVVHFKPSKYGDGGYKCSQCDKRFQWKRDLKQHERYHTGEKVLFCSVCEKQFITKQALLHHVVVHTGEKPFQCAVCGNKFTQPANLRTHVKKKHNYNPESNKNNRCEYCGEPHQSVVSLHQHLLEDHPQQVQEEREILAREKQMKLREKLQKEKEKEERRRKREALGHKVRKPKRKEWEMDFEFYIGDGLVRGVDWDRTPSNGEIACGQCDRKFGWRFEIMFHGLCHLVDEHGNARNKICPECDTPFKVPIGLKHHLITHTGETPFLCLHCWKSFSSHIDLKLHVKKEHTLHMNKQQAIKEIKGGGEEESTTIVAGAATDDDIADAGTVTLSNVEDAVLEESTSHYVQLEDGTYAEMIQPSSADEQTTAAIVPTGGQPIVVKNDKGETMVVVDSATATLAEAKVVAKSENHDGGGGQVFVIATQDTNGETTAILPDNESLERLIGEQDTIEMVVEEEGVDPIHEAKVIQVNEM